MLTRVVVEGGTGRNGAGWDKQVWSGADQAAACPESRGNGIRIGRVWVVKSAQYFVDPLSDYIQEARVAMGWASRASQAWGRSEVAVAHKGIRFQNVWKLKTVFTKCFPSLLELGSLGFRDRPHNQQDC